MVNFDATPEEIKIIEAIAERGATLLREDIDFLGAVMDVTACHCNGNPLRLQEFLDADAINFMHDFVGIHNHIDRHTGRLTDMFLPRFSIPNKEG